jgi:hypothetical protein
MLVLTAALAASAFAGPAAASDVYLLNIQNGDSTQGVLNARPGETNNVTVAYDAASSGYVITDTAGIRIFDQPPVRDQHCTQRSSTTVVCRWTRFAFSLGDGNDRLDATNAARPETIQVERYRDGAAYKVVASRGVNGSGGLGDDVLIGSAGADGLAGADDGGDPPEDNGNDTVSGGGGPDDLVGLRGNDKVDGGDGDDVLAGGPGNDVVDGGPGDDDIEWIEGNDALSDSGGDDQLLGGPGLDEILAVAGRDPVDAGDGDDLIDSKDGKTTPSPSTIACGSGIDKVEPARSDTVSGCERLFVVPGCTSCTVFLRADLGKGKTANLVQVAIGTKRRSFLLVTVSAKGRALIQQRGSLRVRFETNAVKARPDWFVLKA